MPLKESYIFEQMDGSPMKGEPCSTGTEVCALWVGEHWEPRTFIKVPAVKFQAVLSLEWLADHDPLPRSEASAIKLALEKWRYYLEGVKEPFKLWTDHKNLAVLIATRNLNNKQVSVYQVLDQQNLESPEGKKLLSARLLAVHGYGWEVFSITQAVRDWTEEESSNQGLLVTVQGLGGAVLEPGAVQFASGRDHHESKKPMLVLFTDDGRRGAALPTSPFSDLALQNPALPVEVGIPQSNRTRAPRSADEQRLPCQLRPLLVDFEEIGWNGWIISPRGYNAFHCRGSCPFPLGENMRPTNHATVQSIINALKLSQDVSGPCCVPDKLYSINLLYFDDDENVVLKQYDDMVAGSCGCH
ncbi:bone morphogenetic protein 7-like [Heteronotia binoei]|uniref:bone morphogenetic protein 7-like n=1 Tax=Heteronotia binoei TaxID=13085 RepID=UPI00292EACB6|nr:bone morphogenetic protein 7-like [Heteronotia binoei]